MVLLLTIASKSCHNYRIHPHRSRRRSALPRRIYSFPASIRRWRTSIRQVCTPLCDTDTWKASAKSIRDRDRTGPLSVVSSRCSINLPQAYPRRYLFLLYLFLYAQNNSVYNYSYIIRKGNFIFSASWSLAAAILIDDVRGEGTHARSSCKVSTTSK